MDIGAPPSVRFSLARLALVFFATLFVYYLTSSPFLDEWDSVQFALGVYDFNLFNHTPHPPGYPLYIFWGKALFRLFSVNPVSSLTLASALAGALFVTCWLYLARQYTDETFSWLFAICVAILPGNWMTATKVLTDMPSTAMIALELVFVARALRRSDAAQLIFAALAGAAVAGFRPQNFGVALFILVLALYRIKAGARWSLSIVAIFLAANLAWALPTLYSQTQAGRSPAGSPWLNYPLQILRQWKWRLDKPSIYVGAGGLSPGYLVGRIGGHIGVWASGGFGFYEVVRPACSFAFMSSACGSLLTIIGWLMYFGRKKFRDALQPVFWKEHLAWALLYAGMIFICLPKHTRYYCPIYPLLLMITLYGWWTAPGRLKWGAMAVPALLVAISLPLAIEAHTDMPPPLKAIEYLKQLQREKSDKRIVLITTFLRRHANWYSKGEIEWLDVREVMADQLDGLFTDQVQLYTETPRAFKGEEWSGAAFIKEAEFKRSPVIHQKHFLVKLYRIVPAEPGEEEAGEDEE